MNELKERVAGTTIGLALSGGGVRAAAFHAGVLRYLADRRLLERVIHVSSVSGGSLLVGMVFQYGNCHWPQPEIYVNEIFPHIRRILTTQSLQSSAILRLIFNPLNWRFLINRANVLEQAIRDLWGIKVPLDALGSTPVWSINCTAGETGRRFRFKSGTMGDYKLGYARSNGVSIAKAMATSAAFPCAIGPLTFETKKFHWEKRENWEAKEPKSITLPYKQLHLYDGGVYDNLGIEPLFDVGTQSLKANSNISYLIVSDAGAQFTYKNIPHPLNPWRFNRLIDIFSDQTHLLRVRSFVNFLQKNPREGAFIEIGTAAESSIRKYAQHQEAIAKEFLKQAWLSTEDAKKAAAYPTNLKRLNGPIFDLLAQHGYETTKWNVEMMSYI